MEKVKQQKMLGSIMTKMAYNFTLSYSTLSTFKECQRQTYFYKVVKLSPEKSITAYGNAGDVPHKMFEKHYQDYKDNKISIGELRIIFNELWSSYKLDTTNKDPFFRLLPKEVYWDCVKVGLSKNINVKTMEYKYYLNDIYGFPFIGYVDVIGNASEKDNTEEELKIINKNKNLYSDELVYDWKTNTTPPMENGEYTQKKQLINYSYLSYKKTGKLPRKCYLIYLKKDLIVEYFPTLEDINKFDIELKQITQEINSKKSFKDWIPSSTRAKDNYSKGVCFFCKYKNACKKADEQKITLDQIVDLEADYMLKTQHPEAYKIWSQIEQNKSLIKNDSLHLNTVNQNAAFYYLTLDEMLQIEAEKML